MSLNTYRSLSAVQTRANTDWLQVGVRLQNSSTLKAGGNIYVWGKNYNGQLGIGTTTNTPTPVLGGPDVDKIDAGAKHAILNSFTNGVFVTGSNTFNQLGSGPDKRNFPNTSPITPGTNWANVESGECHNILESGNGEVYRFGRNNKG